MAWRSFSQWRMRCGSPETSRATCVWARFLEKPRLRVPVPRGFQTLGVQVPIDPILAQNLYYDSYDPKPRYLNIGYMHP